jgi:hypothetical protein
MFLRVGVEAIKLDPALIADMDDFGIKRGEAAHSGVLGQVTKGVNPRDEFEQVRRIVEGLKELDRELDALLSAAG